MLACGVRRRGSKCADALSLSTFIAVHFCVCLFLPPLLRFVSLFVVLSLGLAPPLLLSSSVTASVERGIACDSPHSCARWSCVICQSDQLPSSPTPTQGLGGVFIVGAHRAADRVAFPVRSHCAGKDALVAVDQRVVVRPLELLSSKRADPENLTSPGWEAGCPRPDRAGADDPACRRPRA